MPKKVEMSRLCEVLTVLTSALTLLIRIVCLVLLRTR